ncbi:UNVERIFIED_CONTAM: dockerin type I repeat protein [Acetivibrio alkalicellulosi]
MKKMVSRVVVYTIFQLIAIGCFFNIAIAAQSEVVFSHKGGFYSQPFDLHLHTNDSNAVILYTTDGSEPVLGNQGTYEYSGSIQVRDRTSEPNVLSMISNIWSDMWHPWIEPDGEVFKCTTIRAVSVGQDGSMSNVITHSYFVNPNMSQRYQLPVISITGNRDSFFDAETGIYVNENYENRGEEWERSIHLEFFEEDGTLGFSQNAGIRIHGGWSRKYPQKSFRLYARREYDEKHWFDYDVFPGLKGKGTGEDITRFKRLLLRASGNDIQFSMFRDGLMQGMVSHMRVDTQAFRPSVVFLNGEFWGIYNIRERYDNRYFQTHYDLDRDRVAVLDISGGRTEIIDIDEGTEQDAQDYRDFKNYLGQNDIRQQSTYDYVKTKMDIDNFIDYQISQIYFANTDWPANNVVVWRYNTRNGSYDKDAPYGLDGRWRWAIKDTDFGFGLSYGGQVDHDTLRYASTDGTGFSANRPWAVFIFKTLLQNDEFRTEFINRYADHLNTAFIPDRVNNMINEMSGNIAHIIPEQVRRWNRIEDWDEEIEILKHFANNRPAYVRQHIINNFRNNGITGTSSINFSTDNSKGFIRVNSIDIIENTPGITNSSEWTGIYFNGVPVTITAVAKEGYEFERWEGIVSESDTVTVNPQNNMNIRAVFKESSTKIPVMIGDLNGDNRIDSTDYVLLRRYVLGISNIPSEDKYAVADLNLDGRIDSTDCVILRRYLLEIIDSLPY